MNTVDKSTIENTAETGGWLSAYLDLKANGLHWKKAAYAAWFSAPKTSREPKRLEAKRDETGKIIEPGLDSLLGYASGQVFHKWRRQPWFMEMGIDHLRESILLDSLAEVDLRTISEAKTLDGSPGVQARKLFYEELFKRAQRVELSGAGGGPIEVKDVRDLTDEELLTIATGSSQ